MLLFSDIAQSLTCAYITTDWGYHACYCLPLIIGIWCFAISPPHREAFHLCCRWERPLYRILSPALLPCSKQRYGRLLDGVALPAISSSIPRRTTLSVLWFLTLAFSFFHCKGRASVMLQGSQSLLGSKKFQRFWGAVAPLSKFSASVGLKFLSAISCIFMRGCSRSAKLMLGIALLSLNRSLDIFIPSPCFRLYAL